MLGYDNGNGKQGFVVVGSLIAREIVVSKRKCFDTTNWALKFIFNAGKCRSTDSNVITVFAVGLQNFFVNDALTR